MTALVEVYRARFDSRADAELVAATARELGLDVEVREAGAEGVIVIVEEVRRSRCETST